MRATNRLPVVAIGACVALAGASLAVPADPVYDAWAWLVWGRELTGTGLDLGLGPSWKPLPVAITALLSPAGDAAPSLWLVLVRAAWLLALVLAGRLAYLLTAGQERGERIAAAALGSLSLVLLRDPIFAWLRQGAEGMSEPLLVAFVLCAVLAGIGGRARSALAFGALAALLRPEVWPLLALYGLWCWRREPGARLLTLALALAVPALWFGPELMTAGDALGGAERAQREDAGALQAVADVAQRAFELPLLATWPLALLAAAGGDAAARRVRVLLGGALAWIAVVALMAGAGDFAGLPRFMAPAGAVVGVLGGVGLARLLALARARASGRRAAVPTAALAALLAVLALQVALRAGQLHEAAQVTVRVGQSHDRLRGLVRAVGNDALLRCGDLATSDVLVRTALAWELDAPLADVVSFGRLPHRSGAFVIGPQASWRLRLRIARRAALLGRRGEWLVYSLHCPARAGATASSSGTRRRPSNARAHSLLSRSRVPRRARPRVPASRSGPSQPGTLS
jgi:hypothetical protein